MSFKLEPTIWSHDTGQRIPCFDRCQLTIAWMFNIKDTSCKPRLQDLVLNFNKHYLSSFLVALFSFSFY